MFSQVGVPSVVVMSSVPRSGPSSRARTRAPDRARVQGRRVIAVLAAVAVLAATAVLALRVLGDDSADATSVNGWPTIGSGHDSRLAPFPWVTGRVLAGDVSEVLGHVAERFDAEVERVDLASSWGWADRTVRGSSGVSNHASATAVDLNALRHPLGVRDTFTPEQVATIRDILEDVEPAVVWGGDFGDRADEMHFEIVGDAAGVAVVAERLRAGR